MPGAACQFYRCSFRLFDLAILLDLYYSSYNGSSLGNGFVCENETLPFYEPLLKISTNSITYSMPDDKLYSALAGDLHFIPCLYTKSDIILSDQTQNR